MFLGYNLSLLTPFAIPGVILLSKSTGYNLLPVLTPQVTLWALVKPPLGRHTPICVFEIKLSVVCAGAFSFFMLFLGKVALYDGGFPGFLCMMYFSMYYFIKSQAFICI